MKLSKKDLFEKYASSAPRYTSFPPVPYWHSLPTEKNWIDSINQDLSNPNNSFGIYIHLPFCESLCTYCGCNTVITKNHDVEAPYIKSVVKEWQNYLDMVPNLKKNTATQIHLGGGTPTFLSIESLSNLLKPIMDTLNLSESVELSFEADPRKTSVEQLKFLKELGFNRFSLGVQDLDAKVQESVNRVQSAELIESLVTEGRRLGYISINYDLIYGLPHQHVSSIKQTMEHVIKNMPDRIALYSFAYVPWIKPAQRKWVDDDLPKDDEKYQLYETAHKMLLSAGYKDIGMDHFALETDDLYKAYKTKKLHRNFMGYTNQKPAVLLGLGASSISETTSAFHQNLKVVPSYEKAVEEGKIPTLKGHMLNEQDKETRDIILKLMTQYETEIPAILIEQAQIFFKEMIKDEIVKIENNKIIITEIGKPFLRNVAVFFDFYYKNSQAKFSKTV